MRIVPRGNLPIMIQAPSIDSMKHFLESINVDFNTVKDIIEIYTYHVQVVCDGRIIHNDPVIYLPNDICILENHYDLSTLHWSYLRNEDTYFDFSIIDYVFDVYKYDAISVLDATKKYFNEKLKNGHISDIPISLYETKLYQNCITECLKLLYKTSYYNEDDFYHNGPMSSMHEAISKLISSNRLHKFKDLSYNSIKALI